MMTRQQNAYKAYASNKAMQASPAELTLMLYDGAIKFCNLGITAIRKNDIQEAHNNIRRVEKIVLEFKATLNDKYEVSKDFEKVYDYMLECLRKANVNKDASYLEETMTHMRTMRDTWKEVMRLNQLTNKTSAQS